MKDINGPTRIFTRGVSRGWDGAIAPLLWENASFQFYLYLPFFF